ncbi:MAG: class I SAM-dependent methyltransferase [Thermoanaerobaculia bacterium]
MKFSPGWKKLIPAPLRELRRRVQDEIDVVRGRRDRLEPPARFGFPGYGDYREIGRQFLELFRRLGGLQPGHRVLEIGCGTGRMALPLAGYLSGKGQYDGIDVSSASIRWCRTALSRKYRNFRFQHADVFNREYNPTGRIAADAFTLPFPDRHFDFVFLTSVFTHMLPPGIQRYLADISRVLSPGGAVLATFFLVPEANGPAPAMAFDHVADGFRTVNRDVPEQAVAVSAADVRGWYARANLEILEPLHRGAWSGIENALTFQDLIIAKKG